MTTSLREALAQFFFFAGLFALLFVALAGSGEELGRPMSLSGDAWTFANIQAQAEKLDAAPRPPSWARAWTKRPMAYRLLP